MTMVNKTTLHIHEMGSKKWDINTEKITYPDNNQRLTFSSMLGHLVYSNID